METWEKMEENTSKVWDFRKASSDKRIAVAGK